MRINDLTGVFIILMYSSTFGWLNQVKFELVLVAIKEFYFAVLLYQVLSP